MPHIKHTARSAHAAQADELATLRQELLAHRQHHTAIVRDLVKSVENHTARIAALEKDLRVARANVTGKHLISPRVLQPPAPNPPIEASVLKEVRGHE